MMQPASGKYQPAEPDVSPDAPETAATRTLAESAPCAPGVVIKLLRGRKVRVVDPGAVFGGEEDWLPRRGAGGQSGDWRSQGGGPLRRADAGAFTLIELVVVMALLVVLLGVSVPSLARSFHGRDLQQEVLRLLAVTEYARDEATSTGAPMVVWVDASGGRYGAQPKTGFEDSGARNKEYTLHDGLQFQGTTVGTKPTGGTANNAVEFEPDGTLDPSSVMSLEIVDRLNNSAQITQTKDAWGYEIVKAQ